MFAPFDPWQSMVVAGDVAWATHADAEQLNQKRHRRLRSLVAHATKESPLYRQLWRGGDASGDWQLADLPVMHKGHLMHHFDEWVTDRRIRLGALRHFTADPSRIAEPYLGRYVVWESSGSSGTPAVFVQDAAALAVYDALEALRHPWPRPLQRWLDPWYVTERLVFMGAISRHFAGTVSTQRLRRLNPALANRIHEVSFLQSTAQLAGQLEEIGPTLLATYPSAALLLAEEQAAGRLNIQPQEIWTGGETLTPSMREYVQSTFGCPVADSYGASEFLTLAFECRCANLHLNSDWAILEPVDAKGRPVPPDTLSATALLTNLANRVQPLIRYDLGDRISLASERCECGSHLPVMHVQGRSDDTLLLRSPGNPAVSVLPLALCTVLEDDAHLYDFQLEQTGPCVLELRTALRGDEATESLRRGRAVLAALLGRLGVRRVDIHIATGRPNRRGPGGKVRRVVALSH